jgi:hypothetical protein
MNKEQLLGIVRHALTFAGGYLVTKGIADSATASEIIGALVTLSGAVWSILHKKTPTTPAA